MTHPNRSRLLVGAFGLAMFLSGCGEDNQEQSRIEGTLPTDSMTPEERIRSMQGKGAPTGGSKAYPGANRK
ncbi:hypothetical protein P12x_000321 [Tundrisphaera lichenicola]|uniref:hypothetical protein n=1 Tax=Tundrisphaera lichenicola TaxID=2029860 RepID=UPI003EBAA5DE